MAEQLSTPEEMLRVSFARLKELNLQFHCRENDQALVKIEEALMWLNRCTEDRKAQGVEGKHEL